MTKFRVKPSKKENWRYIAFKVISETVPNEKDLTKALTSSIIRFLGETGASKTNIWLLEFNKDKGLIRCSHKAQTEVIASITTITKINESKALINVLGVSGTIRKARQKYLNTKVQPSKIKTT